MLVVRLSDEAVPNHPLTLPLLLGLSALPLSSCAAAHSAPSSAASLTLQVFPHSASLSQAKFPAIPLRRLASRFSIYLPLHPSTILRAYNVSDLAPIACPIGKPSYPGKVSNATGDITDPKTAPNAVPDVQHIPGEQLYAGKYTCASIYVSKLIYPRLACSRG